MQYSLGFECATLLSLLHHDGLEWTRRIGSKSKWGGRPRIRRKFESFSHFDDMGCTVRVDG